LPEAQAAVGLGGCRWLGVAACASGKFLIVLCMPADERNRTSGDGFGRAAGSSDPGVVGELVVLGAEQDKVSQGGRAVLAVGDFVVGMERPCQGPVAAGVGAVAVSPAECGALGGGG
jgi:hypothetical protein